MSSFLNGDSMAFDINVVVGAGQLDREERGLLHGADLPALRQRGG